MIESNTEKSNFKILRGIIFFLLVVAAFLNQKYLLSGLGSHAKEKTEMKSGLPPSLALTTIALGPLRGLIANALWWRVSEQQEGGNYFEIIQLADWITAMQPDNPRVWTFQAWNMAYNVAYEFPDANSKWKWIYRAYRLLVFEALKYNRGNNEIRKETARIFLDRIGSAVDPGAPEFKKRWAELVVKYIPGGSRAELKLISFAPQNEQSLRKFFELDKILAEAEKLGLNLLDRDTFYSYQKWTDKDKKKLSDMPGYEKSMVIIDSFIRARGLRDELGLDPKRMLYIDVEYGPFDWRLFQAHVVYWDAKGSFREFLDAPAPEQVMIRQAMTSSFLDGKLLFQPEYGVFVTTGNFKIVGKLHDYYEYMMIHGYSKQIDALHKSFLEQAAAILYTFNQIDAAKEVFEHYKEGYANKDLDFETYISESLYKTLHNTTTANNKVLVESSLFQAYNWLATGDIQRATGYANFAKMIWRKHQAKYGDNPARRLPPLEDMMRSAFEKIMASGIAPEFKKRLGESTSIKEFDVSDEKADTGEIMKTEDAYRHRTKDDAIDANPAEYQKDLPNPGE